MCLENAYWLIFVETEKCIQCMYFFAVVGEVIGIDLVD